MARTKKSTATKKSTQERTTYPFVTNVTSEEGGVERLEYRTEQRTYGEGPVVGLKNGLKKELERNAGSVIDKTTLSAFGGEIVLATGSKLYASAVFADAQCPACGASRDNPHAWCDACQGNVEVDLEAEAAALADEF